MPIVYMPHQPSPYPQQLREILNQFTAAENRQWLTRWPGLITAPSPLYQLPKLAKDLGLGALLVKDESTRSPLRSFKVLGAPLALLRLVRRLYARQDFEVADLIAGVHAEALQELTVISATDGNHGRALAAAAQALGCACVIVLHHKVSQEREEAIAAFGARILRVHGNYDDSVDEAARLAAVNGWQVVSDTSYPGYEEVPRDVMQGYATIAAEVIEQTGGNGRVPAFSHVLLQGGVGGLAAGVASYLWEHYGTNRPRLLVVEPAEADCLLQSARAGRPAAATGSVDSLMAGLACGQPSPLAWRILQECIDCFVTVGDQQAVASMGLLARGLDGDIPIEAGESGAAGLAGLQTLLDDNEARQRLGLDHHARVLLINSEGATSPSLFAELLGEPADNLRLRQRQWLAAS